MTNAQRIGIFLLGMTLGWMYFWAGVTKVVDPAWSAAGFLKGAKTFPGLFAWFGSPGLLPITNFLNEWGLTLLGISLLLGVGIRLSSKLGIVLMILYYLPVLNFPYPNPHAFLVDEHIIYIAALLVLESLHAGRFWGLGERLAALPFIAKHPKLQQWIV
jgi:thiosulfate dehydrogenase [quinone] large subunit